MNKIKISIFTLALSILTFSCGESVEKITEDAKTELETTSVNVSHVEEAVIIAKNVNATEFSTQLTNGALLLDVRTAGEVSKGAIEGYTNLDFNSPSFKSELEKLDKNKAVCVYCAVGGRSGMAMKTMQSMGFKEVYNLNGGYNGWPNK